MNCTCSFDAAGHFIHRCPLCRAAPALYLAAKMAEAVILPAETPAEVFALTGLRNAIEQAES